jgi:hypothetical protein
LKTDGTKQKHHFLPETITSGSTAFHHTSATEIVPNRTWCHAHPDVTERRKNQATFTICHEPGGPPTEACAIPRVREEKL